MQIVEGGIGKDQVTMTITVPRGEIIDSDVILHGEKVSNETMNFDKKKYFLLDFFIHKIYLKLSFAGFNEQNQRTTS